MLANLYSKSVMYLCPEEYGLQISRAEESLPKVVFFFQ